MKTYQYQLVKYMHDQFTGEFVNMGVIVYAPEIGFLDCCVTRKTERLSNFFSQANVQFIMQVLSHIETQVKYVSQQLAELYESSVRLEQITSAILPPDNSAIRLSNVMQAIDIDMDAALNGLFYDLVKKYETHIATF